jgi:ribokinase
MDKRVLILSSAYIRFDAAIDGLPGGSSLGDGLNYTFAPGGKGITAALTCRALGVDSILCGAIGDDDFGRKIERFLDRAGVDRRFLSKYERVRTGLYLTLYENGRGHRSMVFRGANDRLSKADIETSFMVYPDALYIQNELPYDLSAYAVNIARSKNIPVIWHPCAPAARGGEILPGSFETVIFDASEVASYCGVDPSEYEKFLPAAMALASHIKAKYYIIRLPDRGTFIYDGLHHEIAGDYPTTYLDENGASVVYGAAFTAAYLKTGGSVGKAVKCAAAAYAYSSSNRGDAASVPSASDLVRFLKKDR